MRNPVYGPGAMAATFRHQPPSVGPAWIDRPRVTRRLDRRFEVDVLTMVAPAGYGKTTALGLALAANQQQDLGIDIWLQCGPRDVDAEVLADGLLVSAGHPAGLSGRSPTAATVADILLAAAPESVCLVLDDVHVLTPGSGGATLVGDLVTELPANAHLVLSGRTLPPLRLARLRTHGRVDEVDRDDLAYDDEEVDRAAPDRVGRDVELSRWPALAAMAGRRPTTDSVDFLLEEVIAGLEPSRRGWLTALSLVRTVDDELAAAATGAGTGAAELVGSLPLVQRTANDAFQLHDLWRDALLRAPIGAEAASAVRRVADQLRRRGRLLDAAEVSAAADDVAGLEEALLGIASQPIAVQRAADLRHAVVLARAGLGDHALTTVLEAYSGVLDDERASAEAFEAAAAAAGASGDDRLAGFALGYAANLRGVVDPFTFAPALLDRAATLAARGDPGGRRLHTRLLSHMARAEGRPEDAAEGLRGAFDAAADPADRVRYGFAMCDLGRPEEVSGQEGEVGPPEPEAVALAGAFWLRGDLSPEVAMELGRGLAVAADDRQVPHVQISVDGVFAIVAGSAGDAALAREFADRAARLVERTASAYVRTFAALADATCLLVEHGEDAARERVAEMLELVPVAPWPYRSYLYALPFIYLLAPEARPALDACRFGPSLTTAQEAGRALVALREHDDPARAAALPWHRPTLLRAHVLPPHLGLLAAAAAAAGEGAVGDVLSQLPSPRENLVGATTLGHQATANWARRRVEDLPVRPSYDLAVAVLGPLTLTRGSTPVTDETWLRRARVRQLFAYLLLHGRVSRRRAVEDLWPELSPEKAMQNLRVNLNHLQGVLQPHRRPEDRPWFLRADPDHLALVTAGLSSDAARFEAGCTEARRLDESARGSLALERYDAAVGLYQGDWFEDGPLEDWVQVERVRLRSLAVGAQCRLGELLLARGEPEEAAAWAATALRHEPLLERAHRLFVRGLAGQGNLPAARSALGELLARLADERLAPERDTALLADSLLQDAPA